MSSWGCLRFCWNYVVFDVSEKKIEASEMQNLIPYKKQTTNSMSLLAVTW